MASRDLPNLALKAFFDLGEDGWDDEMSLNLLKLSVLVQATALDKVSADPGSPADGDVYIFDETHPTQANKVAIRDAGAWVYVTPFDGWLIYNQAAGYYEKFDETAGAWAELATGGGGGGAVYPPVQGEAGNYTVDPADVGHYIRLTSATEKNVNIDPEATTALPDDGEWHFRNVGVGDATIVPGSGVTVNPPNGGTLVIPQGGSVTLKRAAADIFDLMGQVVAA